MSWDGASLFTFPLRIRFGPGTRCELGAELAALGVKHPLIVTDPGVLAAGLVADVLARGLSDVTSAPPPIFSDVQANPTEADVSAGLEAYRLHGCDGLIAIGGGSPIDAAKAIRLLVTHPGVLADYDFTTGGSDKITAIMPPMIAVPTTAGTGSEAGRGTLIQLPSTGRKTIALSQHLLPNAAICDPELTLGLSPIMTAGTGMDALTHCVESYLSPRYHPMCDGIALEGLRHIRKGLEISVRDGANLKARTQMMTGALLGGVSFHKGLGVVHSLSHALGAEGRAHHGTLNAILLPHALRFNWEGEGGAVRLSELAISLNLGRGGDGPGHLITLTELLLARLPLPRKLGEVAGLRRDRIDRYAELAMLDHCHRTNLRPCTVNDMERLLTSAW